jgi:3-oxoacyl-[acyl-carrier-protein] synthase III
MKKSIGIIGVGSYVPPDVRTNDWWPQEVVAQWRERRAAPLNKSKAAPEASTTGARAVAEAMAEWRDDPFHGAVERRVMKEGQRGSELELEASRNAIKNAGIEPGEIGLVLCNTFAPDFLVTNNACLLHQNLGLSRNCFSMATEAGCNAFMMQMALAEQMISGGRTKYALLVQTANMTPLLRTQDPLSAWFGDGCAAVVVGAVPDGYGVLGHAHRTRGEFHRAIVGSVGGDQPWYEPGRVQMYSLEGSQARESFLGIVDMGVEVATEALAEAGCAAADIDFYAAHQPTRWFRRATQEAIGMRKARYVDTFPGFGSMAGANIAFGLDLASREGMLRPGDLVLSYAGGAGLIYSSMVMRWGS